MPIKMNELVFCHCGSGRKRGWWKAHCAACQRNCTDSRIKKQAKLFFQVAGWIPKSEHVMVAYVRSRQELARQIARLFELHPKIVYVEILRFRSERDSEQKIRDDVDVHHRITPMLAPPGMTSEGQTLN